MTPSHKCGNVVVHEDDLEDSRRALTAAALRGESLKDFVTDVLESHLERHASGGSTQQGWRAVLGKARREDVKVVDAITAAEFEHADLDEWQ